MQSTPSQKAYINDLYNKLGTGYKDREKPADSITAAALIRRLKEMNETMRDRALGQEEDNEVYA